MPMRSCVQDPMTGRHPLAMTRCIGGTVTVVETINVMTATIKTSAPAGTTLDSAPCLAKTLTSSSRTTAALFRIVYMVSTTVAVVAPWQLSPCRNRRPIKVGLMLVGTEIVAKFEVTRE